MSDHRSMRVLTRIGVIGLAVLFVGAGSASAITMRGDVPEQQYFDLAAPLDAVGRIYTNGTVGSGTLVSSTQFLTAAHVVDSDRNGIVDKALSNYSVRFGSNVNGPDYTLSSVASISIAPNWSSTSGDRRYDLAILTFNTPFLSISPMALSDTDPTGMIATVVGYGLSGTGDPGSTFSLDGLRRAGHNTIDGGSATIRTDFDSPAGDTNYYGSATALPFEASTAGGDSGSPLLVDFGQGNQIVGVLSGGFNPYNDDYEYGDVSIWSPINNADNIAYLQSHGLLTAVPQPAGVAMGLVGVVGATVRRRRGGRIAA
jgi:V8-like Glu-specific endopeptidase